MKERKNGFPAGRGVGENNQTKETSRCAWRTTEQFKLRGVRIWLLLLFQERVDLAKEGGKIQFQPVSSILFFLWLASCTDKIDGVHISVSSRRIILLWVKPRRSDERWTDGRAQLSAPNVYALDNGLHISWLICMYQERRLVGWLA